MAIGFKRANLTGGHMDKMDKDDVVSAPEDGGVERAEKTIEPVFSMKLRDTHVGLYLIMRFIAMCFTITMIATFFAESLLNTLRLNSGLLQNSHAWLKGNSLYELLRNIYPDGNTAVMLINSDLVAVYTFVIVVYAVFRFTYYRAIRGDKNEAVIGILTWGSLNRQPIGVRLCWFFSFRHGVHKKFFLMWMIYIFLFGITTAVGGLFGVGIYISPMLKFALYGAGAAFCFGLLEDLKVFKKIPPKEAIVGTLLALVEGIGSRNFSNTIKRIGAIAEQTQETNLKEIAEVFAAITDVLKAKEQSKTNKTLGASGG